MHSHNVPSDALLAFLDNEASAVDADAIRACPECLTLASEYGGFQAALRQALYRVDCPSAHLVGEYGLDVLDPVQRPQVAAHLAECELCIGELRMLRAFLSDDSSTVSQQSLGSTVRTIFARLVSTPPAGRLTAAVRDAEALPFVAYETDSIQIGLAFAPGAVQDTICVDGLIISRGSQARPLGAIEVRLTSASGAQVTTSTDDLGNFACDDLVPGAYRLELSQPGELIMVPELRIVL